MATTAATASRDKAVRRAAQAQEHADDGGGGGIGLLLIVGGAAALGVYELMKAKTASPPPANPSGLVPPAGYPADWCKFSGQAQFGAVIYKRLLGAWPAEASSADTMNTSQWAQDYEQCPDLGPSTCGGRWGIAAVAWRIVADPEQLFLNNISAMAAATPLGNTPLGWATQAWSVILNREPGSGETPTIQDWANYDAANGDLQTALNMTDSPEFDLDITNTVEKAICTPSG